MYRMGVWQVNIEVLCTDGASDGDSECVLCDGAVQHVKHYDIW